MESEIRGEVLLKRVSDIVGMKVVDSKGSSVGEVERVICSRTRGRVLGIALKRKRTGREKIVHYRDILSFGDDLLIISDRAVGRNPDGPEISRPVEGEDITGYLVLTANGKEIGVVKDTVIGENSGTIEGYMVAGDLFEDLLKGRKILRLDKTVTVGNGCVVLDTLEPENFKSPGGLENLLKLNDKNIYRGEC
jgi:uncharacterized protein YrrD